MKFREGDTVKIKATDDPKYGEIGVIISIKKGYIIRFFDRSLGTYYANEIKHIENEKIY